MHLEYFASVEAIADAKAEIFRGLEPGGAAVINRDNPHYATLAKLARGDPRQENDQRPTTDQEPRARSQKRSPTVLGLGAGPCRGLRRAVRRSSVCCPVR